MVSRQSQIEVLKCSPRGEILHSPPNDAATATEPATLPAAVAAAANPLAPITGIMVPNVGAKALNPAAIAGAAKPVEEHVSWKWETFMP